MSFKYVNPGYGELLPVNSYFSYATIEDWTKNTQNGVMAYFVKGTYSYSDAPKLMSFDGEIYGKYILYSADNYGAFGIYFGNSSVYLSVSYNRVKFYCSSKILDTTISANGGCHSVYFHYKLADNDNPGLIELTVDNAALLSRSHSYTTSNNTIQLYATNSVGSNYRIGNLIFSNEYINPKEEVIILPTSGVVTDMTDNQDGTYTANEAGQTLLQTVNATDLITQYGRNSRITSIAPAGIPAYNNSGALSLVGIDKISGTITEHDTIALSTNSLSGAFDLWNTNNLTIGDLDGKQIGWKAVS